MRGEVLPFRVLSQDFHFDGQRVPLLSMQGIFKPAVLPEMPISITTRALGKDLRYRDEVDARGFISYCYRDDGPDFHENVGLRKAWQRGAPLIYLVLVEKGWYQPFFPTFVVGDDPEQMRFTVAVDDEMLGAALVPAATASEVEARRLYVTRQAKVRVHQRRFSAQVVAAYSTRCAVCRIRHKELLDAAHILRDGHPRGDPVVPNGISLCKIHHAAFDANILGVSPECVVAIREDVLREIDGPMLEHGLQGFHGRPLKMPRLAASHPDRDRLAERFDEFRRAV